MTIGQFKAVANRTYPDEKCYFGIGGDILKKMTSWTDEEINKLTVGEYEQNDNENEDGDIEHWFFITAVEKV